MVQVGGPAAINGFLYQILKHLNWLASVHFTGQIRGSGVTGDACIILEPKDGGDARLDGQNMYLVEQYKTRSDRTWSAQSIINDVLPDLRMAVLEPPPVKAEYRFVTDGREGRLENFRHFLAAVQKVDQPEDLEDSVTYNFGKNLQKKTFRYLFDHIVNKTGRVSERYRVNDAATVFHLLKYFQMDFEISAESSEMQVDKWLRPLCANSGDEVSKRRQLIGTLIERLSKGETRIAISEVDGFLRANDLNPESVRRMNRLDQTLRAILERELVVSGYNAQCDVRRPPPWPTEKPILVVTGVSRWENGGWGSGEGKTWQLLACLCEKSQAGELVVWLRWERGVGVEATLTRAANVVWQEGLGFTDQKTVSALWTRYQDIAPGATIPWLTIAIDNVQDKEAAGELVSQRWEDWGIRLAMSMPQDVRAVLEQQPGDRVHIHELGKFSISEVDDLLSRSGRSWAELPSDLQQILRVPILAGLYLKLPFEKFETAPHSEYEIFGRFWERMTQKCELGDDGILTAIARQVVEKKSYPLAQSEWQAVGLDAHSVKRLLATGWLICRPGGLVEFAHDRLLNWAIAVEAALSLQTANRTPEQVGDLLVECAASRHPIRLGYVPMDTLWLLAKDGTEPNVLVTVIVKLEASHHYGSYGNALYAHLLPTLGQPIVDTLMVRLDQLPKNDYRKKLIADALSAVAQQDGSDLSELNNQLLQSDLVDRQTVGIILASVQPSAYFLDRLWQLHQERCQILDCTHEERKQCSWDHQDYELSFAALRACVATAPDWLRHRIKHADQAQERVSQLAYLLNSLDHPSAPHIWSEVKDDLTRKVSPDRPRSLLYCIGRFRDHSFIEFLLSCLTLEADWASSAALANLVRLDPNLAIERLAEFPRPELAMARNWWLPYLLVIRPMEVRLKLLEMAANEPKGWRLLGNLFTDRTSDLDNELLQFYLRGFEAELKDNLRLTCETNTRRPYSALHLLNNISHPDLLTVLREEAGGDLERMVADMACSRIAGQTRNSDQILEGSRQLLIRIGGEGITRLLNNELRASEYWERFGGLKWAFVAPNTETIALLKDVACRSLHKEEQDRSDSDQWFERNQATIALAAVGSDEGIVEAIWAEGVEFVDIDLDEIRESRGPLDKRLTKKSSEILNDPNSVDDEVMKALSVAWLSKDADFIPCSLDVLKRAVPEGQIAKMACIVLKKLGDSSQEFLQLLLPMLKTENRPWAIDALLSLGDGAEPHLLSVMNDVPFERWTRHEMGLAEALCRRESTHAQAMKWIVRMCKEKRELTTLYSLAVQSGGVAIQEIVIEKAFNENSFVTGEKTEVIKALMLFDPERAIAAAEKQLHITKKELRPLAKLLVHLTPGDAEMHLVDIAKRREDSLAAVGHALRSVDAERVDTVLLDCIRDSSRDVRAVGAELAGWQSHSQLVEPLKALLERETEPKVHEAILGALERKRQQMVALDLLQAFQDADARQRWAYLLALLEMADPYLLSDKNDPLWIGTALDKAPYIFWRHAERAIEKRKSKIK